MKDEKKPEQLLAEPSGHKPQNRITKYKHKSKVFVKRNKRKSPTEPNRPSHGLKLQHIVVRYPGGDEFVYHPACNRCGGPILDLNMGNISVWNELDDFSLTPLHYSEDGHCSAEYRHAGAEVFLAKGEVYAFHKDCDDSPSGSAWTCAANVFKTDQRYDFEKRWEKEALQRARAGGTE